MEPFATVEDYKLRFGSAADDDRIRVALQDASSMIASELRNAGIQIDGEDEMQASELARVCCNVSKRFLNMPSSGDCTQFTETVGPISKSYTPANPSGDMYLTASERRTLGLKASRACAGFVGPFVGGGSDGGD